MKGVKTVSYNVSWTSPKVQWRRVGGKKRPPPRPLSPFLAWGQRAEASLASLLLDKVSEKFSALGLERLTGQRKHSVMMT